MEAKVEVEEILGTVLQILSWYAQGRRLARNYHISGPIILRMRGFRPLTFNSLRASSRDDLR